VRILKSKYYPAVFSKAPVPSMLHACRESRATAMKWYKLRFRTLVDLKEIINVRFRAPRTYFDLENDILYAGCKICCQLHCHECRPLHGHARKVQKILVHCEDNSKSPFLELCMFFRAAKEVMILGAGNDDLDSESRFDQLVKNSAPFGWQKKPTLQEDYLAEMLKVEDILKVALHQSYSYYKECFAARKVITRVDLARTS
jgi:hypothetical protein